MVVLRRIKARRREREWRTVAKKGGCMDGMVLQHSWLCWWPCDEQCIVSQHCMLAVVAIAFATFAFDCLAMSTPEAARIGLIRRILNEGRPVVEWSQWRRGRADAGEFTRRLRD